MSRVGFEPTTPVFEQPKTVHALDPAAAVIGTHLDWDSISDRLHTPVRDLNCIIGQ
jgi:hypothetical protein